MSRFRVTNYKSFRDSREVSLGPGFNVVVGANNAGKTALAEALSLRSSDKPHRSLKTVSKLSASPDPLSQIEVTFELDREEFLAVLGGITEPLLIPIQPPDPTNIDVQGWKQRFLDAVREHARVGCVFRSGNLLSAHIIGYDMRSAPNSTSDMLQVKVDASTKELEATSWKSMGRSSASSSLATQVAAALSNRVFYFKAERLNIGEANAAYSQVLSPDASNLAQCLHTLQGNPARFQRLNALVGEIFSEVRQITVPLTPDGVVRILIWSIDLRAPPS
jgi:hypothetical protein